MSKEYDLLNLDQDKKEVANFLQQNKIETIRKYFYDLREKWNDKCYEQNCIYGNDHQGIKALLVKLTNFNIREDIKHLSIYSTKEVILDKDIKFNGGNFIVVAPVIKISSKINIDLSGENGISYGGTNIPKAEDGVWNYSAILSNITNVCLILGSGSLGVFLGIITKSVYLGVGVSILGPGASMIYPACGSPQNTKGGTDGMDGLSGTSGKDGGNLIMIAQKYEGIDNLSIDVSGGDGGHGQNGGNGGSCNTSYLAAPTKRAGGDGGNGGKAGFGGTSGNIKIYQQKDNITKMLDQNFIKQDHGNDGIPGKGGHGGIGWIGRLYTSGKNGSEGQEGGVKIFSEGSGEITSQNSEVIKQDYMKFITDYAPEALNNPLEYTDIVGQGTNFQYFLEC